MSIDSALAHSSVNQRAALRLHDRLALPLYIIRPTVVSVDFVLIVCASVLATMGYHWVAWNMIPATLPSLAIGALAAFNFITVLTALTAYQFEALVDVRRQVRYVTLVWICVFLALLGVAFSLKTAESLSRGATIGFWFVGLAFILGWRVLLSHLLGKAITKGMFAKQKTILIGDKALLSQSSVVAKLQQYGYTPIAILEMNPKEGTSGDVSNKLEPAIKVAREHSVRSILLIFQWEHSSYIESLLIALSVLPIPVFLLPDPNVVRYLNRTYNIGPIWTAEVKRAPLSRIEQLLKRMIDLVGASLGILLLSPLLLATAMVIKLDSNGPIFFTQRRSGFNGRLFRIFKFRTMSVLEDGPIIRQATRNDCRFTRIGRFLRRTNVDELPQLFNVLRGEMSLVGPRPHAAAHDSQYEREIAAYAFRYQLKPGITGWAQFNGYRGETRTLDSISTRIELDLWYIKNWSIWLDIKILFGTVLRETWRSSGQ